MNTFLICGFFRSGLTWLSRFLSVPHWSVCLCDGMNRSPERKACSRTMWSRKYLANAELQRHREGRRYERARGALSKPLLAENMTSDHRFAGSSPAGCKANNIKDLYSYLATKTRAFFVLF